MAPEAISAALNAEGNSERSKEGGEYSSSTNGEGSDRITENSTPATALSEGEGSGIVATGEC
jgi:hypothetical protein